MGNVTRVNRTTFRFNNIRVDLHRQELSRDGTVLPVQRLPFDLLVYLLENANRTINRQELQQAVWMGNAVSDAAIKICISKLRRLTGDDSKQQSVIKTVHGYGYSFVAELEVLQQEEAISSLTENYLEALKAMDRLSIAVLPFKETGDSPECEYFSEGIAEDIITELSRCSSLFVTSPETSGYLKESSEDPSVIAEQIGVAYTLQGSIHRSKSRISLTVHLIEARIGKRRWSENYDRELEDIPWILDDISRKAAAAIGGRVAANRDRQPLDSAGIKVYDAILRARWLHHKELKSENAEARAVLEQAVAIAPDNALAYSWLAMVHASDSWYHWTADPEHSLGLAIKFSRKALALDDSESVVHRAHGQILECIDETEASKFHLRRALELNPNDPYSRCLYAVLLVAHCSDREEALQHMTVVNRLDPLGRHETPYANGVVMFALGRFQEACNWLSRFADDQIMGRPLHAAALSKMGELDQARSVLEEFFEIAQEDMETPLGNDEEAWLDFLENLLDVDTRQDLMDIYDALVSAGWRDFLDRA